MHEFPADMKVTVVIPAYNAVNTICRAINSVLVQTYGNLEIIVCDDASTDETSRIVSSIHDRRIRLMLNHTNLGPGRSRDKAIAASTGDWITFCDADDEFRPERIEMLMGAVELDPRCVVFDDLQSTGIVTSSKKSYVERLYGAYAFGADGETPRVVSLAEFYRFRRTVMQPLFSRDLWECSCAEHNNLRFGEDFYFLLSLLAHAKKLIYVPYCLYVYNRTQRSLSDIRTPFDILIDVVENRKTLYASQPEVYRALGKRSLMYQRRQRIQKIRYNANTHNFYPVFKTFLEDPVLFGKAATVLFKKILGRG